MVGADGFVGDVQGASGGRQPCTPSGTPAVPTVHGREKQFTLVGDAPSSDQR